VSAEDWRARAACRDADPEVFFPRRPTTVPADRRAAQQARAICDDCPVRLRCLDAVLAIPAEHDRDGMFAGLSPRDRRDLREPGRRRTPHARLAEDEHLFGGPAVRAARGTALRHDAQGRVITRGGARRDTVMTRDQAARSG
jgi:WhiB family redox-sensing transcriptional regulator